MNTKLITETAKRTLRIECDALERLIDTIDEVFVRAVAYINDSKGRLVVTGIGKSAIVAQKIVATLNSTGSPALFMHAADAIHGDLGMILPEDIILCLSKSGETAEIKALVPLLQHLGNKLIAMTANPKSYLGRMADYCLHTPIDQEGDPNNLAPTARTTAQMALGDAMATSLLALRGFTQAEFARFHPGGSLGKQLYLRVHHLSAENECPKVAPTANLRTCILEMTSKRLGVTAVVDEKDHVLGIITDGDLRRMLGKNESTEGFTAMTIMSKSPKQIEPDKLAVEALQVMQENSISQLIVAKDNKLVGFIHLHDLIKEGLV